MSSEVSPEDLTLTTSIDALLMVVLGGPGTLLGGVLGAIIVLFLREYPKHVGAVVAMYWAACTSP